MFLDCRVAPSKNYDAPLPLLSPETPTDVYLVPEFALNKDAASGRLYRNRLPSQDLRGVVFVLGVVISMWDSSIAYTLAYCR